VKVKFNDLSLINEPYLPVWEPKIREIVRNSQFILGPDVKSFEANFAKYIGVNHCIGVNNGTSALTIALKVLMIKKIQQKEYLWTLSWSHPGLKFIGVPAMTFAATIEAVHMAQLVPVLLDITPSGGLDFEQLKRVRNRQKIDAVIVVHLCGTAVEIPELDIPVIEDNCQGVGSYFKDGTRTGSKGILSAVSFYSGKNLGALGDGGAICTSDPEFDNLCRMLRNHGSKERYIHEYVGMTARLDNLQAMFLDSKLTNLDQENEQRRQVASWYYEQLLTSHVRNHVEFQTKEPTKKNNFHLFVVKTPLRDELAKFLNYNGIETGFHYPEPLNKMAANKDKFLNSDYIFGESDYWAKTCLSLPMHPYMTRDEVTYVCDKIKEFFND